MDGGKVNPAVKFKRGVVAKGAAGLVFEPRDVGERVEPLGEPCHWVMLSLRDETLVWVLEPLLVSVSTSKGATMPRGKRVSLSPRGTISNKGGIAN